MGRTLHYKALNSFKPTDKQEQQLITLSKEYNEKFEWTCENVWLSTLDYYPNWKFFEHCNSEKAWSLINSEYDRLLKEGKNDIESIRELHRLHLISYHEKDLLRGFTKTGGNELNAHTVILFILDASTICPEATFSLGDEGNALYNAILIKNRMAKPDINSIKSTLDYWKKQWDTLKNYGNCAAQKDYLEKLLTKKHPFGNVNQYIRPLDEYLADRPKFETRVINIDNAKTLNIVDLCKKFLEAETAESAQYYNDLNYFPKV
jgi:hypothetical protein